MKDNFKKIFKNFFVLILLVSILPIASFADEASVEIENTPTQTTQDQEQENNSANEENHGDDEEVIDNQETSNQEPQTPTQDEAQAQSDAEAQAVQPKAVGQSLSDWKYIDKGDTVELTGFKRGNWQDIVLPGKLEGKQVTIGASYKSVFPAYMNSLTIEPAEDGTKVKMTSTTMQAMFWDYNLKGNMDLRGLDVSSVTNMRETFPLLNFYGNSNGRFYIDLTGWDVSKVTTFYHCFWDADQVSEIKGLNTWNPASATTMEAMFNDMSQMQSIDISGWNVPKLTTMYWLIRNCDSLTTINANNINAPVLKTMECAFGENDVIKTINANNWVVPRLTNASYLIYNNNNKAKQTASYDESWVCNMNGWDFGNEIPDAVSFYVAQWYARGTILNANDWNYGSRTKMDTSNSLFYSNDYALEFNVNNFNGPNLTTIENAFKDHANLTSLVANNWKLPKVTKANSVFYNIDGPLTTFEIKNWDFSRTDNSLIDMNRMFADMAKVTKITLEDWQLQNANNMEFFFWNDDALTDVDFSNVEVPNVYKINNMYDNCDNLVNVKMNNWNFSGGWETKELQVGSMFIYASKIQNIEFNDWNAPRLKSLYNWINGRAQLKTFSMNNLNAPDLTNAQGVLYNNDKLETASVNNWVVPKVTNVSYFFSNCSELVDVSITGWTNSKTKTNISGNINLSNMFSNSPKVTFVDMTSFDEVSTSLKSSIFYLPTLTPLTVVTNNPSLFDNTYNYKSDNRKGGDAVYDANGGKFSDGTRQKRYPMTNVAITSDGDASVNTDPNVEIPTKEGFTFQGWKQQIRGRETWYIAKWKPLEVIKYNVVFNNNTGSGVMANQQFVYGEAQNLRKNTFTKTGYTFIGWNTDKNATTALYQNEESVSDLADVNGASVTLYAIWQPNTYYISFDANGGNGQMPNQPITYDQATALDLNQFSKDGYSFKGWAKTSSGAVSYKDGQEVKNLTATDGQVIQLYAVWEANTYEIIYHKNSDTATGTMANQSWKFDTSVTLKQNAYKNPGYIFMGWSTTPDGAVVYQNGQVINNNFGKMTKDGVSPINDNTHDVNLYAVWQGQQYTVKFNANGGTGQMADETMVYGKEKPLDKNKFTNPGHKFLGWATTAGATKAEYSDGQSVINLTNQANGVVNLYAVWQKVEEVTLPGEDGILGNTDDVVVEGPVVDQDPSGSVTLPEGGSVIPDNGTGQPVDVPNDTVVNPDGTITVPGADNKPGTGDDITIKPEGDGTITMPGEDNNLNTPDDNITIKPDGDKPAQVNPDGSVTLPDGGSVKPGANGPEVNVPGNSTVNPDGSITLPGEDNKPGNEDDVTIKPNDDGTITLPGEDNNVNTPDDNITLTPDNGNATINPDGSIELPDGGTLKPGENGPDFTLPDGSVVTPDGTVNTPGGSVKPNEDGTITLPGEDNDINNKDDNITLTPDNGNSTINPDGSVTLPDGGTLKPGENGPEITLPDNSVVDNNGNVTLPGADNTPGNGDDVTIKPNEDGSITLPGADNNIDSDQDNVVVTPDNDATINPDGSITLPDGGSVKPGANGPEVDVPNDSVVNPDGTITLPGADNTPGNGDDVIVKPNEDGTITLPGADNNINTPDDNITITPDGNNPAQINPDGSVTLPDGGSVKPGENAPEVNVPDNSTVNPDGTITLPGEDNTPGNGDDVVVKPNEDGTITLPGDDNNINTPDDNITITPDGNNPAQINPDGSVTLPDGGSVKPGINGPEVNVPDNSVVNPDGTITLPGADNTPGNGDDVTINPNEDGTITLPGADNDINNPADNVVVTPDNGNATINPDGSLTLPDGGSVKPGANGPDVEVPENSVVNPDGTITLPGADNTPGNGDDVVVKPNEDGTITLPGADNNIDTDDDNITITPDNGNSTINPDGSITLPEGGSIKPGENGPEINVPDNSIVNPDGTITLPGLDNTPGTGDEVVVKPNEDGSITLPGADNNINTPLDNVVVTPDNGNVTINPDGSLTLPEGGTVTLPDGSEIEVPENTIVNPDGTITLPGVDNTPGTGDEVTIKPGNNGTIALPGDDNDINTPADNVVVTPDNGNVVINPDGSITLPEGGSIKPGANGPEVNVPDNSVISPDGTITLPNKNPEAGFENDNSVQIKPNEDGSITLPGKDHELGTDDDVTLIPNGDISIDANGNINLPNGGSVITPDGTIDAPQGSTVLPDGTVIDKNGNILHPDGSITHPGKDQQQGSGDEITIYPSENGNKPSVNPDGSINLPNGGMVDSNGTIILPGKDNQMGTDDDVIISTNGEAIVNPNGSVTLPQGGKINIGNDCSIDVLPGGVVSLEGIVINPGANEIIDTPPYNKASRTINASNDDQVLDPSVVCPVANKNEQTNNQNTNTGVKGLILPIIIILAIAIIIIIIINKRK